MIRVEQTITKEITTINKVIFRLTPILKSLNFLDLDLDLDLIVGFLVVVSLDFVIGDIVLDKSCFLD